MENRVGSTGGQAEFEYKIESKEPGKWYQGEKLLENNDRFSSGFDDNRQWLKILRITDSDFFPDYSIEINGKKVSAKLQSGMNPITEKNENNDYKGDEMGDDIKNIDLNDPVANAAASKIQNLFRSKGKGLRERILANRKLNVMSMMKKAAKAFSGTTFKAYSLEIVKPQPSVKQLPAHIAATKPNTKWFRDPSNGYWVQIQTETKETWGAVGEFRKVSIFEGNVGDNR